MLVFILTQCPLPFLASIRTSSACILVCPLCSLDPFPLFITFSLSLTFIHIDVCAGQQVALVGRVKDCSPDMARVEAADGADVTIKRNGCAAVSLLLVYQLPHRLAPRVTRRNAASSPCFSLRADIYGSTFVEIIGTVNPDRCACPHGRRLASCSHDCPLTTALRPRVSLACC